MVTKYFNNLYKRVFPPILRRVALGGGYLALNGEKPRKVRPLLIRSLVEARTLIRLATTQKRNLFM